MNLIKNGNGDVFLDTGSQLLMFDGTPVERTPDADGWEVVGSGVDNLFVWRRDPGQFGPHYAVGNIVLPSGDTFVVGGSIVFINAWCNEHEATFHNAIIVTDRNTARRRAEVRGGAAW